MKKKKLFEEFEQQKLHRTSKTIPCFLTTKKELDFPSQKFHYRLQEMESPLLAPLAMSPLSFFYLETNL